MMPEMHTRITNEARERLLRPGSSLDDWARKENLISGNEQLVIAVYVKPQPKTASPLDGIKLPAYSRGHRFALKIKDVQFSHGALRILSHGCLCNDLGPWQDVPLAKIAELTFDELESNRGRSILSMFEIWSVLKHYNFFGNRPWKFPRDYIKTISGRFPNADLPQENRRSNRHHQDLKP